MKSKWQCVVIFSTIWFVFTVIFSITKVNVIPESSTKFLEVVKFIAISISAYGVLFSVLLTSFNTLESEKLRKETNNQTRINNSFLYMQRFDSSSIKEARDITRKMKKEKSKLSEEELIKRIEGPYENEKEIIEQENLKRSVITMFNFFEEIYLSINNKHSDETVLKEVYSEMYVDIYDRFKCWLEKDNHMGKLQLKNLQELKKRWE